MEFTLGIKPFTIMEAGKVIYGRLLLLHLMVELKSQGDMGLAISKKSRRELG